MCAAIQTVVTFPVWHGEGGDLDRETSLLLLAASPQPQTGSSPLTLSLAFIRTIWGRGGCFRFLLALVIFPGKMQISVCLPQIGHRGQNEER